MSVVIFVCKIESAAAVGGLFVGFLEASIWVYESVFAMDCHRIIETMVIGDGNWGEDMCA